MSNIRPSIAGPDGVQLVLLFADRRALRSALDVGTLAGTLGTALSAVLAKLQGELPIAGSAT